MAEVRLAARKLPIASGNDNSNGVTNNRTRSVLAPNTRIRRRHHIATKTARIRRERRTYTLGFICLFLFFLASFYFLRSNSNAEGDDDMAEFMRKKPKRTQIHATHMQLGKGNSNPKVPQYLNGFTELRNQIGNAGAELDSRMPKTNKEKEDLILKGKVQLINVNIYQNKLHDPAGYEGGVEGHFCFLDWEKYRNDPSAYPMFRDLVFHECKRSNSFTYDIQKIVRLAETYDTDVRAIEPTAFIFHESRCGSTLIANALTAMSPTEHLVYSEAQALLQAVKACGIGGKQCPPNRAVELFQDIVFIMGLTNEPGRNRLFFKIQSMATKYMSVAMEAFPDTPWVFLYRDPVQIMMSQFKMGERKAICVRQLIDVPKENIAFLKSMGRRVKDLNAYEKCAFHLVSSCLCIGTVDYFFKVLSVWSAVLPHYVLTLLKHIRGCSNITL